MTYKSSSNENREWKAPQIRVQHSPSPCHISFKSMSMGRIRGNWPIISLKINLRVGAAFQNPVSIVFFLESSSLLAWFVLPYFSWPWHSPPNHSSVRGHKVRTLHFFAHKTKYSTQYCDKVTDCSSNILFECHHRLFVIKNNKKASQTNNSQIIEAKKI